MQEVEFNYFRDLPVGEYDFLFKNPQKHISDLRSCISLYIQYNGS